MYVEKWQAWILDVLDPSLAPNRSESELGSARGRQRFEGTVGSEKASRSEFIVWVLCPSCPIVVLLGERMVCMVSTCGDGVVLGTINLES